MLLFKHTLICGALILGLSVMPSGAVRAEENQKVSAQQLRELNSRIKTLEQSLNQVKGAKAETQKKLQESEVSIAKLSKDIHHNLESSNKLKSQLQVLRVERIELSQKQAQQKDYLEKQIRAAYAMGRQEYLKVLLNQQQPDQVSRVLRYYDYINRQRSRHIDEYIATSKDKARVEKEITQKDFALGELRSKLEERSAKLEQEQKNREQLLASLDSEIKDKNTELDTLNQDRARLEKLLKEIEQAIVNIPVPKDSRPFNSMKGKLPWPIKGLVAHGYGSERIPGKLKRYGLEIRAKEGAPIKAIHSGRVVFADWLRGYGVLMIIDHGNGYMSLYGHNQALLKEQGDWVHAGENIATVGRSGGQSRSSLYFEIRQQGQTQDPIKWLGRRRG